MPNNEQLARFAPRQLKALMAFLVLEFILGVSLTTVINYVPNKHSTVQTWFVALHVIVAFGLLLGSIARLVVSLRTKSLQTPSIIGFVGILAAFVSGIFAARSGANAAVLLMALFFLVAFMAYGYSLGRVLPPKRQ